MISVYCKNPAHNMKKTPYLAIALFLAAGAASAARPAPLEVTEADLEASGVPGATQVSPVSERFLAPVHYFRTTAKLSASDAKKDCSDCADLLAVYTAPVSGVPNWVTEPEQQFLKIGGRLQLRAYLAATKRVVIVTGPNEADLRKVSSYLVSKFSR